MLRLKTYRIEEVLPFIVKGGSLELDGEVVRTGSIRMCTFKEKGLVCVTCGIVGTHFVMEKSSVKDKKYHLNLYGIDGRGREILMTHDHIVSLAMGGANSLENCQTMCAPCNCRKGDGRKKPAFKYDEITKLLTCSSTTVHKKLDKVIVLLKEIAGEDERVREVFSSFIHALNDTHCESMGMKVLKSIPCDMTIEEYDTHHKDFISIGKKGVVIPSENGLDLYHRNSHERMHVSFKGV